MHHARTNSHAVQHHLLLEFSRHVGAAPIVKGKGNRRGIDACLVLQQVRPQLCSQLLLLNKKGVGKPLRGLVGHRSGGSKRRSNGLL